MRTDLVYCPKCGFIGEDQNPEYYLYCSRCGTRYKRAKLVVENGKLLLKEGGKGNG